MSNEIALFGEQSTDLSAVPVYDEQYVGAGNDNVSADDVKTPAIFVLQKTSQVIGELEGAKPGKLWNNITDVCSDSVTLINLGFRKSYIAGEKQYGGATLGVYDTYDEAAAVIAEQQNPDNYRVTDVHKHTCLLLKADGTVDMPVEIRFRGTSQGVSRDWNAKFLSSKTPRCASVWKMTSKKESNSKGEWFMPAVDQVGWVPPSAIEGLEEKRKQIMGE
ncbi:hypothetical protein [Parendozoicomonas haliclonae]|nr:hypothetical protein [Parendozoicomonas haliclonae]